MKVSRKAFLVAALTTLGGGLAWLVSKPHAQSSSQHSSTNVTAYKSFDEMLEEKSLAAKSGDERAVRELADLVFAVPIFLSSTTASNKFLKDKFVRAEVNFRKGKAEGISESNIVQLINELVDKFRAPEYAKATLGQVRILRAGHNYSFPKFMDFQAPENELDFERALKESNSSPLSPLQAAFVTLMLIQQKMRNEEFQVTPDEWNAHEQEYQKRLAERLARWQAYKAGRVEQKLEAKLGIVERNPKEQEINEAIKQSAKEMSYREAIALVNSSLAAFGIK